MLSSTAGIQHDVNNLQHSAPVNHGNSGGSLLDTSGNVIGINVMILREAQNTSFAVKMGVTRLFLESFGVPYSNAEGGAELRNEEIMAQAQRYTVQILCHQ